MILKYILVLNHTIALRSKNYRGGIIIAFQRTRNFGKRSSSYEMRSILVEVDIFCVSKIYQIYLNYIPYIRKKGTVTNKFDKYYFHILTLNSRRVDSKTVGKNRHLTDTQI